MFSQANEVGCTFLLEVNNELQDVAKGSIIQPRSCVFHNLPIPPNMFRIALARVLPGCEYMDPPHQPAEADSELKLGECLAWPLLWPKTLIRLDPAFITPQTTTPPVGSAPSHDKATPPVPPSFVVAEPAKPTA